MPGSRPAPAFRWRECGHPSRTKSREVRDHEDHTIRMGEDVPDQHSLLPAAANSGRVARDRRIKIDRAPIDEDVRAQRAHALGDGIHDDDRVRAPRISPGRGPGARPQVHDLVTTPVDANSRPDFVALRNSARTRREPRRRPDRTCPRSESIVRPYGVFLGSSPSARLVDFAIGQTSIADGGSSACLTLTCKGGGQAPATQKRTYPDGARQEGAKAFRRRALSAILPLVRAMQRS